MKDGEMGQCTRRGRYTNEESAPKSGRYTSKRKVHLAEMVHPTGSGIGR